MPLITIDPVLLHGWVNAFVWPFIRILALLGTAPVLGESSVPMRLKVAYAILMALLVAPALGPQEPLASEWGYGLLRIVREIAIGISMGLTIRVAFAAVQTAGEFIGLQMGLSFASFFDPATGANTAVLARLMNVIAMLLFLALDGHLMLIGSLIRTFEILPIDRVERLDTAAWTVLFEWSAQVMVSGMLLALPLIIILLTISLSMGILNRTAQQLSVFAVGFPISLSTGLLLLMLILPQTAPFMSQLFDTAFHSMERLLDGLSAPPS